MKKTLWFIVLVFSSMILKAQTDIIYPADRSAIIFDCKINEVKNGNMVYYTKNQLADSILAVSITKDGNYIDLSMYVSSLDKLKPVNPTVEKPLLFQGYNFEYYQDQYFRSKGNARAGVVSMLLGTIGAVGGISLLNDNKPENDVAANVTLGVGIILINVGIPLVISGGIKANNNKRAMDNTGPSTTLSFGSTMNGIGLRLALN